MTRLQLDLDSYRANSYGTHNYHPYPAKFIPQIPRLLIERYSNPGDWVLDPFCGSGTTLVEATASGRNSIGIDVNPMACLVSQVKTARLSLTETGLVQAAIQDIGRRITEGGAPKSSPPNIANLNKWFAKHIQDELCLAKDAIAEVGNSRAVNFLLVAFSSILVKVSYQESDTRYRAVDKNLPRGIVGRLMSDRVAEMLTRQSAILPDVEVQSLVLNADATRELDLESRIDLVVTSPPYLNSYDYYLYHKHRLAWLGYDHYIVQEREFGSRNKHNDRGLGADAYESSIAAHVQALRKHLRIGAKYACVVGDGVLRGELHKADAMFDKIFAALGFLKVDQFSYDQRKYTKAFTPNLRTTSKQTHVLVYQLES